MLDVLPRPLLVHIVEFLIANPDLPPSADDHAGNADSHPYVYTPPAHLPPSLPLVIARLPAVLCLNKAIYSALSPGIAVSRRNGELYPLQTDLYARLYCRFFDVKAVGRRWRRSQRRQRTDVSADDWDRDVHGVTDAGLTAQFVQLCKVLKFFWRSAVEMGIPLPKGIYRSRKEKGLESGKQSLADREVEKMLLLAFVMMTENDGKNHHQLRLVSAPLFVDMLVYHRLDEGTGEQYPTRYNNGWPVENVLNTTTLWLMWMFTDQEKVASESLSVRMRVQALMLPFIYMPYRVRLFLISPIYFLFLTMFHSMHPPLFPQSTSPCRSRAALQGEPRKTLSSGLVPLTPPMEISLSTTPTLLRPCLFSSTTPFLGPSEFRKTLLPEIKSAPSQRPSQRCSQ